MIPHKCPKPWFGPDDYTGEDLDQDHDPVYLAARRQMLILIWHQHRQEILRQMPWYKRLYHYIFTPSDELP